jgi:hypothetical protein
VKYWFATLFFYDSLVGRQRYYHRSDLEIPCPPAIYSTLSHSWYSSLISFNTNPPTLHPSITSNHSPQLHHKKSNTMLRQVTSHVRSLSLSLSLSLSRCRQKSLSSSAHSPSTSTQHELEPHTGNPLSTSHPHRPMITYRKLNTKSPG